MRKAFVVAALILLFLVVPLVHGSVGIGCSDYDLKVVASEQLSVTVGQITNIGNVTLFVSYVWQQTNSTVNMTLPVSSKYANYTLLPGARFEPVVIIGTYNDSFAGNYSGIVQASSTYAVQGSGDAVVPGAAFHLFITVGNPPVPKKESFAFLYIALVVAIAVIVLLVCLYWVVTRKAWKRTV
jgi:hypothetical protein